MNTKVTIPVLTAILIVSQLTACGASTTNQASSMIASSVATTEQDIKLEIAVPKSVEQGKRTNLMRQEEMEAESSMTVDDVNVDNSVYLPEGETDIKKAKPAKVIPDDAVVEGEDNLQTSENNQNKSAVLAKKDKKKDEIVKKKVKVKDDTKKNNVSDNNDTDNKNSVSNTKKGTKNDINKGQQNNKDTNIKVGKPIKKDKANNNNKADKKKDSNKNNGKQMGGMKVAEPDSGLSRSAHPDKDITEEELDMLDY